MSSYIVRVARPSDYQALAALLAELLGQSNIKDDLANALNTNLLRLLSTPGTTLLVAQEESPDDTTDTASEEKAPNALDNTGQDVIGFISLFSYWGLLDDAPNALLDRVVVAQRYQSSSVVAALLEQGVGACQAMGCSQIQFVAAEGSLNPKETLEKMGFVEQDNIFNMEIR